MPKSTKRFTLTTDALNSHGYRMLTSGADIVGFKKNPLLLFNHIRPEGTSRDQILPLGYWDDLEMSEGSITGVPVFDDKDEFAMRIYHKVEHGTLRMCSVGARPLETSSKPEHLLPLQLKETVLRYELKEASICDIGSNPDALTDVVLYDVDDNIITLSEIKPVLPLHGAVKTIKMSEKTDEIGKETNEDVAKLTAKIADLTTANEALAAKLAEQEAAAKDKEAIALADSGVAAGKYVEAQKAHYIKLAKADLETTKLVIEALPVQQSAKDALAAHGEQAKTGSDAKLAKLITLGYDELWHDGNLEYVKLHAPDKYAEIYKEKFNIEPQKA